MSAHPPGQSGQQQSEPMEDKGLLVHESYQLREQLAVTEGLLQNTRLELEIEKTISKGLKNDLGLILNSRSWKITRPLRQASRVLYLMKTWGLGGFCRRVLEKLIHKKPQLPLTTTAWPVPGLHHPLQFTPCAEPLISIVIPVYNKSEFTFHCLKAIHTNTKNLAYEILVIDDCSTDDTQTILQDVQGITVLRNDSNSGFIASCNKGASAARGEYLVLLNNDTEPQAGWLSALLNTFAERPDAGMVGAKLLFANGTLQEAGGIVWQDGSAWNYGRNDDPNRPEYSYLREADYCSGACLLLPLADFKALGMFDSCYTPAYYEDTDLAFKVRQAGKKVYYQSAAHVVHFEGVSNGTDLNSGVKEYQRINHLKFFERWQQTLAAHRPHGQLPALEKERSIVKRVLIVDPQTPTPDRDSGSLRMVNLLRIFQQLDYKVTFYPDNLRYYEKYTPMLQALGVECIYAPYCTSLEALLNSKDSHYNVVLLSRADCAEKHLDTVRRLIPHAHILFDTVDLHFLRELREAQLSGSQQQMDGAAQRKVQELNLARKADQTLVVSPVELALFHQEAPDVKLALLSNIHKVEGSKAEFAARRNILFIGNFMHPPNVDAMHWFIDEVCPLLHAQDAAIKVYVVGGYVPPALSAKASDKIQFTGFLDDTATLFNIIRLSIAPLRYGAGVKGKINSSMSYGVPVIATTVAAEGMGLEHEQNVLLADDPRDFADAIVRAYNDAALWQRLSKGGMQNIEECFSFAVAKRQLSSILADIPAN